MSKWLTFGQSNWAYNQGGLTFGTGDKMNFVSRNGVGFIRRAFCAMERIRIRIILS